MRDEFNGICLLFRRQNCPCWNICFIQVKDLFKKMTWSCAEYSLFPIWQQIVLSPGDNRKLGSEMVGFVLNMRILFSIILFLNDYILFFYYLDENCFLDLFFWTWWCNILGVLYREIIYYFFNSSFLLLGIWWYHLFLTLFNFFQSIFSFLP